MKVSISKGNSKMGAIPSVSLPPITTCAAGCTCAKKCYAAKLCRGVGCWELKNGETIALYEH